MNKVLITGRISKEVNLQYTKNGIPFVFIDVAVVSDFPDRQGKYPTSFIQSQVWNKKAEYVKNNMEKGQLIDIVGHVVRSNNNGIYNTNIIVDNIKGLEVPKSKQKNNREDITQEINNFGPNTPYDYMGSNDTSVDDNLPF